MLLNPPRLTTDRFTWVPSENTLVAEMSDLPEFGRVWDDACDVGYTVVSSRTGKEIVYAVHHEEKQDGDLVSWILKPAERSFLDLPTLTVYND